MEKFGGGDEAGRAACGPGVDPALVAAWLGGRSLARGLPPPVADHGGWRVDTGSGGEIGRWVFADVVAGLGELASRHCRPGYLFKLCGSAEAMRSALPPGWAIGDPAFFMQAGRGWPESGLAFGYRVETSRVGGVSAVRIWSAAGDLAASGHAAETPGAFVYDRIATAPAHRRRGLGRAVMTTLRACRQRPASPELLVATAEGRALYASLGWDTLSPYVTASWAGEQAAADST